MQKDDLYSEMSYLAKGASLDSSALPAEMLNKICRQTFDFPKQFDSSSLTPKSEVLYDSES